MKRKVMLFIAASLDGYIAKKDGDISWLSMVERPGEDYGYESFINTVDTVIMGRKTYDKVLSFGIDFPHKTRKCYVLSKTRKGTDGNVEYINGDITGLIAGIREKEGRHIFCDGGSEIIHELMKFDLIDTMTISLLPVLLGDGIRLFKKDQPTINLILTESRSFPSGLVQLTYDRDRIAEK